MNEPSTDNALSAVDLSGLDAQQAVIKLVRHAVHLSASDVFFSACEYDARVSVRHMGRVKSLLTVTKDQLEHFVNHVKAVAGMAVDQKLRPLDGRWVGTTDDGKKLDLRISTIPTLWGENMSIRILRCDAGLLQLKNLGFHKRNLKALVSLINRPSGLILVTGPAGAGKTTTMYACLNYLNDGSRKIHTIEDPVEVAMPGVDQSEVRAKAGPDFPELLRSVVRQSPDVIMIGEIRDSTTAETAVLAANSGHLVFATLHAPASAGAINSMLALGVNPHFLASSLLGGVSQRLVLRLCDRCKIAFDLSDSPHTFNDVSQWLEPGQGKQMFAASGCEHCHQTGFSGRTAVGEVLRVSKDIRSLIFERRPREEIREKAGDEGMLDLRRSALLKVAQGITSTEEVMRTIPAEHLLPDD